MAASGAALGYWRPRGGQRRAEWDGALERAYQGLRAGHITQQRFRVVLKRARQEAHASLLLKLAGRSLELGLMARQLLRKASPSLHRLAVEATVEHFRALYRREPGSRAARDIPPYVAAITVVVTEEEVERAVGAMRICARGPDGLDLRVVKALLPQLKGPLAAALTLALTDFPQALARGRTTLLPKTRPPSVDAELYRGITVLMVLRRLFLKVHDMQLDGLFFGPTPVASTLTVPRRDWGVVVEADPEEAGEEREGQAGGGTGGVAGQAGAGERGAGARGGDGAGGGDAVGSGPGPRGRGRRAGQAVVRGGARRLPVRRGGRRSGGAGMRGGADAGEDERVEGRLPLRVSLPQAGFIRGRQGLLQVALFLQLIAVQQAVLTARGRESTGAEPPVLVALLLDLEKCFDMIDHEQLLDVCEHTIGLPPQWLEIIRRVLAYNATTVFGQEVIFERGAPQGGACSPKYCAFMLEDLVQFLDGFLEELARESPLLQDPCFPDSMRKRGLLWLLLLFADDVTVLGVGLATAKRFLRLVGAWATLRKLRWSPKSIAAVVAGFPEGDSTLARDPLPLQEVEVAWEQVAFKHLGVPVRPYVAHKQAGARHKLDGGKLAGKLAELQALHHPVEGRLMVLVPLLRRHVMERVYGKFLYPAAVVDVDYTTLDKRVRGRLRSLLVLPPGTVSLLLHSELRLLPAELQAHRRALRMVATCVAKEWWYRAAPQPLLEATPGSQLERGRGYWFSGGPVKRWEGLLVHYRDHLFPGQGALVAGDPRQAWRLLQRQVGGSGGPNGEGGATGMAEWRRRVELAVEWGFEQWGAAKRATYPPALQAHLNAVLCERGKRLPAYLARTDFLGVVGLHWKLPGLRIHDRVAGPPKCLLCGEPGGECSKHLLACQALWQQENDPVGVSVIRLRELVREEMRIGGPAAAARVDRGILRLAWAHQTPATLTFALRVAHALLNRYRRVALSIEASVAQHIWPLRVYGQGSEAELISEEDERSIESSERESIVSSGDDAALDDPTNPI